MERRWIVRLATRPWSTHVRASRVRVVAGVLGLLVLITTGRASWAATATESVLEESRRLMSTYEEDPARIDRARELLESALPREPDLRVMLALAKASYLWGDLRATQASDKLAAYERGREVAQRAIDVSPESYEAHFWYAVNTGRWGQTSGLLRSLSILPTLRSEVETVLRLKPDYVPGLRLAGSVSFQTPEFVGGSKTKAEAHFKKGLEIDPRFTGIRVDLAKLYIAAARYAEARQELQRVLEEPSPTYASEWKVKDVGQARRLLASINDKN
jgi:tetratricopeptide (TPR) repeat protein